MSKLKIAKALIGLTTGTSAAWCVGAAIRTTTQPETALEVAKCYIGAAALGSMVGSAASEYVTEGIDEIVKTWNDFKAENATAE